MSSRVTEASKLPGAAPVEGPGVVTTRALALLEESVAVLAGLAAEGALVELPAASLVEVAERLHASSDRLAAVTSAATRVVHHSDVLAGAGFVSTSAWLQSRCRVSRTDARVLVARAWEMQSTFRETETAWLEGEVAEGAVREITRGVTTAMRSLPDSQRSEQSGRAEAVLLDVARRGTVADVARAARFLRFVVDPDGARQAQVDAYDDQQLAFREVGSMVALSGYLTLETAAAVRTALEQVVDGWYRDGSLTPDDQPTSGRVTDRRRARLRRPHLLALALADLAGRALGGGLLGARHGVRPHVTLTADLDRVLAGLGGDLMMPGDAPVLVPSETVARVLCDADVDPVLTTHDAHASGGHRHGLGLDGAAGARGEADSDDWRDALVRALAEETRTILWVGRTQHTTPPRLRRAIEARDRHCAFPGCRVTPDRCQAHHVIPWEADGPTDPSNCLLLCSKHHHAVHEGGWIVTPLEGGNPLAGGHWSFAPPRRPAQPW